MTCARCGHNPLAPVGPSWTFTLPLTVPSQNEASSWGQRWGGQRKRYRAFSGALSVLLQSEARRLSIPAAVGRRLVTLTRLYSKGKRAYDYGNLVGGLKGALDALVKAGLLVDDSPKWVVEVYGQEKAAADGLRIELQEAT